MSGDTPQPAGSAVIMDAALLHSWMTETKYSFSSQYFPLVSQQFYTSTPFLTSWEDWRCRINLQICYFDSQCPKPV